MIHYPQIVYERTDESGKIYYTCDRCGRKWFHPSMPPITHECYYAGSFGSVPVLDTQEQRKAKGAKKCVTCGCYCATETEGQ